VASFTDGLSRNYIPNLPGDSEVVRVLLSSPQDNTRYQDEGLVNNTQGFRRESGGSRFFSSQNTPIGIFYDIGRSDSGFKGGGLHGKARAGQGVDL
jgi:hypothetical protein